MDNCSPETKRDAITILGLSSPLQSVRNFMTLKVELSKSIFGLVFLKCIVPGIFSLYRLKAVFIIGQLLQTLLEGLY